MASVLALGSGPSSAAGCCCAAGMGGASGLYARGTGTLSRNDTLRRTFSALRRAGVAPADEADVDAHAEADDAADVDGRRVPVVEPDARLAARRDADTDAALPSGDVFRGPRGRAGITTPPSGLARLEPPTAARGRPAACEEEVDEASVRVERLGRRAGVRLARLAAFRCNCRCCCFCCLYCCCRAPVLCVDTLARDMVVTELVLRWWWDLPAEALCL